MPDWKLKWLRRRAMSLNLVHLLVTKRQGAAWVLSWPVTLGLWLFESQLRRFRTPLRRLARWAMKRWGS